MLSDASPQSNCELAERDLTPVGSDSPGLHQGLVQSITDEMNERETSWSVQVASLATALADAVLEGHRGRAKDLAKEIRRLESERPSRLRVVR
jgi:hypothetical protein